VFLLGKVLEALGCADVGFALYVGITRANGMGKEFQLATIGIVVFALGYIAERWSSAGE
jgi:hypothetical protein